MKIDSSIFTIARCDVRPIEFSSKGKKSKKSIIKEDKQGERIDLHYETNHGASSKPVSYWPPWHIWLAALLVICMRALPVIWACFIQPPAGFQYLPIGYIPKDWLQYTALIHQPAYTGNLLLANPFTTDLQDGRIILLFYQALGAIHAVTGANVFWLLELSRIPLSLLFMLVLWRFLTPILSEPGHRAWACWLVAFSGGLESLLILMVDKLPIPKIVLAQMHQELWSMLGWNTFDSFFNPLWIAALILLLLILSPMLRPEKPLSRKDQLWIASGLILLWFTHPYSGMAAIAIFAGYILFAWFLQEKSLRSNIFKAGIALISAFLIIIAITFWQMGDPAFKNSSSNILGNQGVPIFWYPLTLGAVGFFDICGWREWFKKKHPWRIAIGGWVIAIMLLHSSSVFSGYKFLMYLHLPLCIVAAPAVADWFTKQRKRGWHLVRSGLILVLLFNSCFFNTAECLKEVHTYGLPSSWLAIMDKLAQFPPGNVLSPMSIGLIIPTFTPHRVFLGHYFMTPDVESKFRFVETMTQNPETYSQQIMNVLVQQKIRYMVFPSYQANRIKPILQEKVQDIVTIKDWTIFVLAGF